MKYFTIEEISVNQTDLENWQIDNAITLVENLLDPLREAWAEYCTMNSLGTPALRITSGIRSLAYNKKVGGSKTSSHLYGYAVDLVPMNGKLKEFRDFCIYWLKDKKFDQFISEDENSKGVPGWIHIGYMRYDGSQRKEFKKMVNGIYYYI